MAGQATTSDDRWMRRGLVVAEASRGLTSPNPFVGAVVVAGGREVASAATGPAGCAHAEVRALERAGQAARGATLYVTLEPCAHSGRTPPCTEAIIAAGPARVVVGLRDPNPVAAGGLEVLAAAGIEIVHGVLAHEVASQQVGFLTTILRRRPHITLKVAQTRTGETRAPADGTGWITGQVARRRVHELRATVDGIMVGSQTAIDDDPALTVRDVVAGPRAPRAIVLDRRGRLPLDLQVVRPATIVATSPDSSEQWRSDLARRGVEVLVARDLDTVLAMLVDQDMSSVLAEPGTTLGSALLGGEFVDRLVLHVADQALADPGPWVPALPMSHLRLAVARQLGPDVEWDHVDVSPHDDQAIRARRDIGKRDDTHDPATGG